MHNFLTTIAAVLSLTTAQVVSAQPAPEEPAPAETLDPAPEATPAPQAAPPTPGAAPLGPTSELPSAPAPVDAPPPSVPVNTPPASAGAETRQAEPGTAGVYNGVFFIRDEADTYRLYFQGRAMIDFYSFFGPGVDDVASLSPTFLLRKVRMEFTGELFRKWQWFFGGDFGNNSSVLGPNQSAAVRAAPADVFVNYKASPLLQVQVGQFDLPFTMETRTPDKFLPFIERSIPSRIVGKGNIKDAGVMVWGHLDKRQALYSAAVVQGDGMNRANVDRRFDVVGRVYLRPLAHREGALKDLQVGASARYGSRQSRFVSYDYPAMSTLGGFVFWRPTYGTPISAMNPAGQTHVIPSGDQVLAAGELRIPTSSVDLTVEAMYARENTREAQDVNLAESLRLGVLESFGYYAELGWWPLGNSYLNGIPGDQAPTSIDFGKPNKQPASGLQLLIKWEQLSSEYSSNERRGGTPGVLDGKIKVNAFSLGANYWIARYIRLSANYVLNMFPDSKPSSPTPGSADSVAWNSEQRAQAPGNLLAPGVDDDARDGAHVLHELLFRVQAGF